MTYVMRAGMAAPLMGLGHVRFHVLDLVGCPMCMRIDRPPIHPVDYEAAMSMDVVPEHWRCHRWGCIDSWERVGSLQGRSMTWLSRRS